ncbi:UNVERIFIED_CONTAM: hypothetical protein GTU68_001185 [Idotea baltica]|nr:hypothetical protein [Idotea baltica]
MQKLQTSLCFLSMTWATWISEQTIRIASTTLRILIGSPSLECDSRMGMRLIRFVHRLDTACSLVNIQLGHGRQISSLESDQELLIQRH